MKDDGQNHRFINRIQQ